MVKSEIEFLLPDCINLKWFTYGELKLLSRNKMDGWMNRYWKTECPSSGVYLSFDVYQTYHSHFWEINEIFLCIIWCAFLYKWQVCQIHSQIRYGRWVTSEYLKNNINFLPLPLDPHIVEVIYITHLTPTYTITKIYHN